MGWPVEARGKLAEVPNDPVMTGQSPGKRNKLGRGADPGRCQVLRDLAGRMAISGDGVGEAGFSARRSHHAL